MATVTVNNTPSAGPEDSILTGQAGDMMFGQNPNDATDPANKDALKAIIDRHYANAAPDDPNTTTDSKTTDLAQKAIDAAKSQLGVQYIHGAHKPGSALDCSGLSQYVMAQLGINIGGDTYQQVTQGQAVDGGIGNAKPGDLLFTVGDTGMRVNGHVAVYIGNGMVIAAPHTGTVVQLQDWSHRPLTAIRRYF